MPGLLWDWHSANQATWQQLLGTCRAGLQQGWSYGEALRGIGLQVERLIVRDANRHPLACAQIALRGVLGIWRARLSAARAGVADRAVSAGLELRLLDGIRTRLGRAPLIWSPETSRATVPRRPVMTGYSTAWLDLARGPARASGADGIGLAHSPAPRPSGTAWDRDTGRTVRRLAAGPQRDLIVGRSATGAQPRLSWPARRRSRGQRRVAGTGGLCGGRARGGHAIVRHGAAATYEAGYASRVGEPLRLPSVAVACHAGIAANAGPLARYGRSRDRSGPASPASSSARAAGFAPSRAPS